MSPVCSACAWRCLRRGRRAAPGRRVPFPFWTWSVPRQQEPLSLLTRKPLSLPLTRVIPPITFSRSVDQQQTTTAAKPRSRQPTSQSRDPAPPPNLRPIPPCLGRRPSSIPPGEGGKSGSQDPGRWNPGLFFASAAGGCVSFRPAAGRDSGFDAEGVRGCVCLVRGAGGAFDVCYGDGEIGSISGRVSWRGYGCVGETRGLRMFPDSLYEGHDVPVLECLVACCSGIL